MLLIVLPTDMVRGALLPMLEWHMICVTLRATSKAWHEMVEFAVTKRREEKRLESDQMLMFSEDERRVRAHTVAHLTTWCERWMSSVVKCSPWWQRPPSKCRHALVDAKDFQNSWCPAEIVDWRDETRFYPPLAPLAVVHAPSAAPLVGRQDTRTIYNVRFLGWSSRWDEWIPASRIKAFGSRTVNPVANKVSATQQWMLRKISETWDLRMTRAHAVTTVAETSILPATDVLVGLLVPDHGRLRSVRI